MLHLAKIKNVWQSVSQTKTFSRIVSGAASGSTRGGLWSLLIGFVSAYMLFFVGNGITTRLCCSQHTIIGCVEPFCKYYEVTSLSEDDKKCRDFTMENISQKKGSNSIIVKKDIIVQEEDKGKKESTDVQKDGTDVEKDDKVKKESKELFSITLEKDEKEKTALKAVLKIDNKEIKWWETNNIANSNIVFKVDYPWYYGFAIAKLSYPASTSALVSWLREYAQNEKMWISAGGDEIKNNLLKENIKTDAELKLLCGKLENIFDKHLLFNDTGIGFLFWVRVFNDWNQFLCVALFCAVGFCLWCRWYVFTCPVFGENVSESSAIPLPGTEKVTWNWLKKTYDNCEKNENKYSEKWSGIQSPQWFVYRNGLAFFIDKRDEKYLSLAEISNAGKDMLATSRLYVHWMLDAIPALGFLGTVIGIGLTMMGTGKILTDELGKQQSRIGEVALSLAFAFDTTLVALVLSLIMGAWLTHRIRQEDESVDCVLRQLVEKIQSQIVGT